MPFISGLQIFAISAIVLAQGGVLFSRYGRARRTDRAGRRDAPLLGHCSPEKKSSPCCCLANVAAVVLCCAEICLIVIMAIVVAIVWPRRPHVHELATIVLDIPITETTVEFIYGSRQPVIVTEGIQALRACRQGHCNLESQAWDPTNNGHHLDNLNAIVRRKASKARDSFLPLMVVRTSPSAFHSQYQLLRLLPSPALTSYFALALALSLSIPPPPSLHILSTNRSIPPFYILSI